MLDKTETNTTFQDLYNTFQSTVDKDERGENLKINVVAFIIFGVFPSVGAMVSVFQTVARNFYRKMKNKDPIWNIKRTLSLTLERAEFPTINQLQRFAENSSHCKGHFHTRDLKLN